MALHRYGQHKDAGYSAQSAARRLPNRAILAAASIVLVLGMADCGSGGTRARLVSFPAAFQVIQRFTMGNAAGGPEFTEHFVVLRMPTRSNWRPLLRDRLMNDGYRVSERDERLLAVGPDLVLVQRVADLIRQPVKSAEEMAIAAALQRRRINNNDLQLLLASESPR